MISVLHLCLVFHQLALCQEYNTIYRIEYLDKPIYAVNTI